MAEPKFDPVTSRDYVPELVTGYKQINEGMDNFWDQEISNYNYAASFAGNDLKTLGEMSETIGGILKEREDKKRQEDFAKGYMWFFENGVPDTAMQAYEEGTKELYAEGRGINDMRTQWEQSGGDIWNSVGFKELNKAEQHGAVVAFVEGKLQNYSPSTNEAMQNATSYEEYKAAESVARLQLYRELGEINPALVNKHLFEGQRKKEQAAYNNWYSERETAIKDEEIIESKKTLESCALTGVDGVNCIMNYVNNYAGLYGGIRGKARREAISHLKTLVDGGVLKDGHVDQLLDTKYTHDDGHVTTYREQYKVEANELEDAVIDYEREKYNKDQTEHQLNAHKDTQAFIKSIPADKITEKGYDLTIIKQAEELITKQKMKYNGYSDPYLTTIIESLNKDKNIIKSRKRDAEEAFKAGELNSETLKEYPIMVQLDPEIIKKAKAGDTVIVDGQNYLDDIESLVKKEANLAPGGYDDGANQLVRHFQAEWKARAIELQSELPEDRKHEAGNIAFFEIKNKFDAELKKSDLNNAYRTDGNFHVPNKITKTEIAETTEAVDNAIAREKRAIKEIPNAVNVKRMFFSEQELIDMQNESAKLGVLVIPEKAKRIAKLYDNLNAIDVINRQRAALGMEPLTSNSLKAFDGLPNESKLLLNYSVTGMTTARAWATTGEDNTALVENPSVLNLFSDDLDFGYKMATYETGLKLSYDGIDLNSKFTSNFDFNTSKMVSEIIYENLDEEQKKDFNRLLFKYSGGENKEALNFLVFKDLQPLVEKKKLKEKVTEGDPRPKWSSSKYKNYEEFRQDVLAWRDRNFKKKNKKEIENYQNKIKHLDPKNRNVPNTKKK